LCSKLPAEQPFHITAAVRDVKDQHVLAFDTIDDDLLAHGKAAPAGTQLLIATAA
jgi:hypothetical protein